MSYDLAPSLIHSEWVILNSLHHSEPNIIGHWYLVYCCSGKMYGFDSLAMRQTVWPYNMFYINKFAVQSARSDACGYHCLLFISLILKGIDKHKIMSTVYCSSKIYNDRIAKFVIMSILKRQ
jgi:hypothetical protein